MTTLDQRILIPASPDKVWNFISDLTNNSTWQTDCQSIAFLTSIKRNPGTRWRQISTNRREYVLEITAWYDRLGYEYKYVDGSPFRENQGRIRLQEIAEGTIVQWTLSYELGGVLRGIRNTLGIKRQMEHLMIDSLRELWRAIIARDKDEKAVHEIKSLMREAPDVESRAQYKPRHPSALQEEFASVSPFAAPNIPEPPIADEDTRPHQSADTVDKPIPSEEPAFLASESNFEKPKTTTNLTPAPINDSAFQKPLELQPSLPSPAEGQKMPEKPTVVDEKLAALPKMTYPEAKPKSEADEPVPPMASSKLDTAQVSVFDLFGLPKPSETQEMQAVETPEVKPTLPKQETLKTPKAIENIPETPVKTLETAAITTETPIVYRRMGLRIKLRRSLTQLRYPE